MAGNSILHLAKLKKLPDQRESNLGEMTERNEIKDQLLHECRVDKTIFLYMQYSVCHSFSQQHYRIHL